jgi:uncharacterized protein (TIGR03437 family)
MLRVLLALVALCAGMASAAGPSYTAAGIVNASSFSGGPFAPNSVIALFGSGLARSTHAITNDDLVDCPFSVFKAKCLPTELQYVRVYVRDQPVPLLFVSEGQINFLIPNNLLIGPAKIRVASESLSGPEIVVTLVDVAPALFALPADPQYVIAQDAKGNLLTADNPAHTGDTIVIYVTGLGRTTPSPGVNEIPAYAANMVEFSTLKVTLNGRAVSPDLIKYAGLTPYCAGLYQINLYLPEGTDNDPEFGVISGEQAANAGLRIPLR